jgi:hypothetical protein
MARCAIPDAGHPIFRVQLRFSVNHVYDSKLQSISFESESRLRRIEESCFQFCSLQSICIPSSVEILGKSCVSESSLHSVSFVSGSRLLQIEACCFHGCSLPSVSIPPSVAFVARDAFDDGVEMSLGWSWGQGDDLLVATGFSLLVISLLFKTSLFLGCGRMTATDWRGKGPGFVCMQQNTEMQRFQHVMWNRTCDSLLLNRFVVTKLE